MRFLNSITQAFRAKNSVPTVGDSERGRNIQAAEECMSIGRRGTGDRARQVSQRSRSDKYYAELYARHWEARKIIDIPVDDMFRKPLDIKGLDDNQEKELENAIIELRVLEKFRNAAIKERLLGGCVILMGVAEAEGVTLQDPLDVSTIGEGDLKYLNVISKNRCSVAEWYVDPTLPNFDEPKIYSVSGELVHESRLIVFDGNPLFKRHDDEYNDNTSRSYVRGFGESELKAIAEDIFRAEGTRNAAYHLVNMASVIFASADLSMDNATKKGQARLEALERVMNEISIYRSALIEKVPGMDGEGIEQMGASFGGVPELVNTFIEVLCAAADIPEVRFLGKAPGGLNTDGKSALENYYGRIEADQKTKLLPKLNKLFEVLIPSVFGESVNIDDVFIEFKPLWVISEKETADTRKVNVDSFVALANTGIFSDHEMLSLADEWDIAEYSHEQDELQERPADLPVDDLLDEPVDMGEQEEVVRGKVD